MHTVAAKLDFHLHMTSLMFIAKLEKPKYRHILKSFRILV